MKLTTALMLIAFATATLSAQTKPTTDADYDGTLEEAARQTNYAFPSVLTVVTKRFEGGKLVSTETEVYEREGSVVERWVKTLEKGGKILRSYSIQVGYGNYNYCSTDGVKWRGPQEFVCPGPERLGVMRLDRTTRQPDKAEYSITEESLDGKPVKIYRKCAVFNASTPTGKASFKEQIATIDSRGFFISVINTEGTLDPKAVTLIRKSAWDFKTKFKPVVAPK